MPSTARADAVRLKPSPTPGPPRSGQATSLRLVRVVHPDRWHAVTRTALAERAQAPDQSPAIPVAERPWRRRPWPIRPVVLPFGRNGGRSASWHVLGQPGFLAYFVGSLVSNLGTWLQNTAQMLVTYQLTRSAFAVGVVTCAQFAGFLVLGPWAAALADRLGSTRVLLASQLWSAGIAGFLAFLTFSGALTERLLIIGAVGTGLAFTFAFPLQAALAPRLAPEQDAKAALAMNSVSYNAGRAIAPVLCVVVVATVGAGWAFAFNAVSFVVFAAALKRIHPGDADLGPKHARIRSGFEIALAHPRILLLLVMVTTITLADDPVLVLGPTLAHQVLAVSSAWPAYFLSALGIGTVLGALVPTKPSSARRAAVPLLALGLSVIIFASGLMAWLSLLAAVAAGIAALLTGAAVQAMLQEVVGRKHAPQVMALWAIAWAGSKPFASIADGWLASHLGLFWAAALLAAPALVVASLELWLPGEFRAKLKLSARALATISENSATDVHRRYFRSITTAALIASETGFPSLPVRRFMTASDASARHRREVEDQLFPETTISPV